MKTQITVISDNIPSHGLEGEWGLSLLIKYRGKQILVDAGASDLFLTNMKKLNEDVQDVDYAVLSHAHYDHANGMTAFFKNNSSAKLYVRESTAADCYSKKFIFRRYIGIPRDMMSDYADRIEKVSGDLELMEGVYLIPHKSKDLSSIGVRESMYRKTASGWIPDDFSHEQSLIIDTEKGLLIINSCSHGGAGNIINDVKQSLPDRKIYGYIGGLHLFNKTEKEILNTAEIFRNSDLEYICTGHCTKEKAFAILKDHLGDRLQQLKTGLYIEI